MNNENLTRDEAALRSQLVSVESYDISLDLSQAADPAVETYPSIITVVFSCRRPGASTFLDFIHGGIDSVIINGRSFAEKELDGIVEGSRIQLTDLLDHNEVTVTGHAVFSTSGEGLHRFVDPTDQQTYLYTQYEPADARRVFANFEQPDLKASFTFHVRAPQEWHVASNEALTSVDEHQDGTSTRHFAATKRMSTYITTVLAGPYYVVTDEWRGVTQDGTELTVPLNITARQSLAQHVDHEEIFTITKQGLDYYHQKFTVAYPWGKYDSAFVPEYNLGAMENPGLVTFTEQYIFESHATEAQHEGRAGTILHEMAHMWFGDLVTMKWWDDLWLKESFADYLGTLATDKATDFRTAWVSFANRRKGWAYVQDQFPTTHPIVADITDLEAADQNFDGITYAKGASVLKQLAAYVGEDAFFDAANTYFVKHAFGNATLPDFLEALATASGRDMDGWTEAWLKTSGPSTLSVELDEDENGLVTRAVLRQKATDPTTGQQVLRPHVVKVGIFDASTDGAGWLELTRAIDARLEGETVELPDLVGSPRPALVLPNHEDLTYALIELDEQSQESFISNGINDGVARATLWASLWNQVRSGRLDPVTFIRSVARHGAMVPEAGILSGITLNAVSALENYVSAERAPEVAALFVDAAWEITQRTTGDLRRIWARTFARAAKSASEASENVIYRLELMAGAEKDFALGERSDAELRWLALIALSVLGAADITDFEQEIAREDSAKARVSRTHALAAVPDPTSKTTAWTQALSVMDGAGVKLSNDHLSAVAAGFAEGSWQLRQPFYQSFWPRLEEVWQSMTQSNATRVIEGLFPHGVEGDQQPAIDATAWLSEHPDAPAALRRVVIEELDMLQRELTGQSFTG
ncbi:aminopeptidase N [Neomicrococcus aestuarii]|uniref:Aminopeptidase N n=1 Tax=Neomicrococcus aestuarii TaxID=556325 RepID=A0A1L2ZLS9_9MICC|nr:aminopeptidase N [Neomicrococcus aestuarii]APF40160.1 aminopeptidase N [Neomicrococcus aestuarii]